MTNLIAIAISIVATNTSELKTNVVESAFDPAERRNFIILSADTRSEKWVTTTVEKIEKLEFEWQGKPQVVTSSTLVSSNTVHLRIKQEWETVK